MSISRVTILASVSLVLVSCNYLTNYHPPAATAAAAPATAAKQVLHSFKKQQLDKYYWSEGAMLGDLNRDGKPDAISGPYWWEGPDFTKRHEIYAPKQTTKTKKDGKDVEFPGFEGNFGSRNAYSTDNFFAFVHDLNGDGWNDVLTFGLPNTPAYLYLNPKGKEQLWERFAVLDHVDNESPTFLDITGDGKPEIVCNYGGNFGYATPDWKNPTAKWTFHPITAGGNWQQFTHGLGVGDINGDGKLDIIYSGGWFEQPASLAGDPIWKQHKASFAPAAAQIYAYDVNGDGRADVITSLAAHGYGLAWHEQLAEKDANGSPQWRSHVFMHQKPEENRYGVAFPELHAVELFDVDGDGLKDIVTGNCYWAHGPAVSPGPGEEGVLYWFKLVRTADKSVDWVPHLIDTNSGVGRQIGVADVNGDGRRDLIIGNKLGTFVFRHESSPVTKEVWEKAQPPVKFASAGDQRLEAMSVVVHTSRPVAKPAVAPSAPQASAGIQPNPLLPGNGVLPIGKDGQPVNTDFETGTLKDWTATGNAFDKQPMAGDAVARRRNDMKSNHAGKHWVGTYEVHGDDGQGTLTSLPFKVTHPWAAFLVAGGAYENTRVELVEVESKKVIFKTSGFDGARFKQSNNGAEELSPVVVDLQPVKDKEIFIRLIDQQTGHWAHLNFDDFKFYAQKPEFPGKNVAARKSLEQVPAGAPANPPVVDNVKFVSLPPEQAAKEMTLPPGFKATLFAGEPDVKQPIAFCIDDRGRLWVVENYTYPIRQPEGKGTDRILVFEDTNHDGKFDKRTVFLEGLNLASGIEYGFGGVWVGAAPYLYFIPVTEAAAGPKPAGKPQIMLEGWSYQDTHEMLNTFTWGPDGWLYGCHGVFTHSHVKRPGEPDSTRQFINAGVWRFHPTKHTFEVFAEGTSNPWGLDFDERGQLFIEACVIPHLFHMIQGARYQRQGGEHYAPSLAEARRLAPQYFKQEFGGLTDQPENPYTYVDAKLKPINPFIYDDIKTIADHAHYTGNQWNNQDRASSSNIGGGHAHAGLMVYLGDSWPAEYRGKLFMNNIHGARINMDVPVRAGSGFVGKHGADFINFNDRSSQVLNLISDQNGSVYMIDWYDKQQCHDQRNPNVHDRSNGRIFKITYGDTRTTQLDLAKLKDEELVKLQLSKNEWRVRHARRILQERHFVNPGGVVKNEPARAEASPARIGVIGSLAKVLKNGPDTHARLRALWALHAVGGISSPMLMDCLKGDDEYVRAWAIQLSVENEKSSADLLNEFARLAKDDSSPLVRLYLASACQRLSVAERLPIVEALIAHAEDVTDHNLPLMYWYAAEPIVGADTGKAVSLLGKTKIPVIREYITRRMTAGKVVSAEK